MKLDFLQDTAGQLLAVVVIAIFASISQTALQGKDIARVADSISEIKQQLAENYDKDDAEQDKADFDRELEIVREKIGEAENRLDSRIDMLDDRITRLSE